MHNNTVFPKKPAPSSLPPAPGLSRLTATDTTSGCFAVDSVKVTASQNFITDLQTDFTDPRCFGDNNGEISVVDVTGGTPPFRYVLNGVAKNSGTFTRDTASGTFTVDDERVLAVDWTLGEHAALHLRANFSDTPSARMQLPRGQALFESEPTIAVFMPWLTLAVLVEQLIVFYAITGFTLRTPPATYCQRTTGKVLLRLV